MPPITGTTGIVGRGADRLLVDQGAKVAAITHHPRCDRPADARLVHPDAVRAHDVDGVLLGPGAVDAGVVGLLARVHECDTNRVVVLSAMTVQYRRTGHRRGRADSPDHAGQTCLLTGKQSLSQPARGRPRPAARVPGPLRPANPGLPRTPPAAAGPAGTYVSWALGHSGAFVREEHR